MSFKPLLQKQTLRIDDHRRGNREEKDWDDSIIDVHIDKRTKYKIDGKIRDVTIRIPINSNRPVTVDIDKNRDVEIPGKLYKEIRNTLSENERLARQLAVDLLGELSNYTSHLANEQKASAALNKLSKYFGLTWTEEKIATYLNDELIAFTQLYLDSTKLYYITMQPTHIELSDVTGWSRHEVWLAIFR